MEGDTSNIIPPRRRPRLIDTLPDQTLDMPPPIARSSMSHPKSKEIPKSTRQTRSQTSMSQTESLTSNDSSLIKNSRELSHLKDNVKTNR